MKKLFYIFIYFLFVTNFNLSFGQEIHIPPLKIEKDGLPAKPSLSVQQNHSVYDYAKMLNPVKRRMLEEKISKYYDSTSTQILIATIDKVNDDISLYATNWAHKWGLGQKNKDNGIFILVSKNNKKITIRTGYGVEHLLTDALSRRIIENDIIPHFKSGDFYGGLNAALDTIYKILKGEYKNDLSEKNKGDFPWLLIFFIIIIIFIIISINSNSHGGGNYRKSRGGPIIFSSGGTSSWGGGSSFGGGFSGGGFSGGFGGGGFGGGGATGGW